MIQRAWVGVRTVMTSGIAVSAIAQPCQPRWEAAFGSAGVNASVRAIASFTVDGGGPEAASIVFAGSFSLPGFPTHITSVARWEHGNLSPLGSGSDGHVFALLAFDADGDGAEPAQLYAGGDFTEIGGVDARFVARWDGATWSPVGAGLAANAYCLCIYDPDGPGPVLPLLLAGGSNGIAGSAGGGPIAAWNGQEWSVPFPPLPGSASSLAAIDEDGDGPNPPALFAGGLFAFGGKIGFSGLARWDGDRWAAPGGGVRGPVYSIARHDDNPTDDLPPAVYVAGAFTQAGGENARGIARWDGATWSAVGGGAAVGGATCIVAEIWSLVSFDADACGSGEADLYAAGCFGVMDGEPANYIARWDGKTWQSLDGGLDGRVWSMIATDQAIDGRRTPSLVIGGDFLTAGGIFSPHIVAWAGCPPQLGDSNCDGSVNALDIDAFVLALVNESAYAATYPECDLRCSDMNQDGAVNNLDIDLFVLCLTRGECP